MKAAIVGSRGFNDYEIMKRFINDTIQKEGIEIDTVISGGARGADTLGERYAKENNFNTVIFPAEWDKYGKSAGFKRNVTIINNCDVCFAFWDGESHGTKHDITLCKEKNKPCYVCYYNN